jgi:hypothetical protein
MRGSSIVPLFLLFCSACAREPTYSPDGCDYLRHPRAYQEQDIKLIGMLRARLGSNDWFEIDCDSRTIGLPIVWRRDAVRNLRPRPDPRGPESRTRIVTHSAHGDIHSTLATYVSGIGQVFGRLRFGTVEGHKRWYFEGRASDEYRHPQL